MPAKDEKRRDPLAGLGNGEPVEDLGLMPRPSALDRQPKGRQTPVRPAEKRRRGRKLTVTFSDEEAPQRLRELAERWGMMRPSTRKGQGQELAPNVSALVEYLLLPVLEQAERGEINPPGDRNERELPQNGPESVR